MMTPHLLPLLFAVGCQPTPADNSDDSGSPCGSGAHLEGGDCITTLSAWESAPALVSARDHHVSFVLDGAVHVALGTAPNGASATRTAERLDGDAWVALEDWPEARIGPGIAPLGDGYVVAGGLDSTGASAAECWSIQPGMVVTDCPPLHHSRYHVAMAAWEGRVYALGGLWQEGSSQSVEDAVEVFDGEAWTVLDPLPTPLTHSSLVAHRQALYVIGGGNSAAAKTDILRAPILADGTLGSFEQVGSLPEGRATAAAFVHNDQLYVLAGMAMLTGEEVDTVLRADLDPDTGTIGPFEALATLPLARAHSHQAPLLDNALYSIGGSIHHVPQADVFRATLE